MGIIKNLKEEVRIIKERDPAIHSSMEVLLYPSFKVMIHYRLAYKLYLSGNDFWARYRRRHTRFKCDWSSDVCSSDLSYT